MRLRTIVMMLAAGLFCTVTASNAQADFLDRVMNLGSSQKSGCDGGCAQKSGAAQEGGCGGACQKGGMFGKGASQKGGCGASQKGGCGASQKGCGG